VDHLWDFEQGLGGFVQLPSPGQAGDSGSCGIQPVSYMHARIFKGPRGILPRGRFVSTYAPGGWQAPSDVYQCTFEDRSHAFTLTPRTMVGLMVSLSKNRYVGLYRCSNDSEALVTATWPGENNQMVHRTLLNVPFSLDKYALFMGERVFVRFADVSSESWSHIQIDDIEVKGAGDVGPCEPAPPSCWFSGPTVFRISKPAEPSVNGGRVYLSVGANPPSPYLQTYVAGVDESQKWTITSLGGGLMRITPNGSTTNSTHLSIDPTTSAVGLTEGTGNNRTWAIAYAGEDDIDGETLWTVKSQSMTAANGRVWLSTSADGSDVGVSSVVIANSRWRIGCLPSTSNACSTYEAEDAKRLGPTQREEYGGSTGFNFTVVEFQSRVDPSPGNYLEWSVSMPSAGSVAVRWRYALAFGSKPLNLSINGAVDQTIAFPNTGSGGTFAHTTAVTLALPSGSNALRLTDPDPSSMFPFTARYVRVSGFSYGQPNIVEENAAGVDGWGGDCTCDDGSVYQVGDNGDYCGSLACVGGSSGTCNSFEGAWSRRKVTCGITSQYSGIHFQFVDPSGNRLAAADNKMSATETTAWGMAASNLKWSGSGLSGLHWGALEVTHDFESPVTVSSYDTDSPYAFTIEYSDDSSTWAPPRYHLAPASTSACDYGVDVDQAGCEAAVAALAAAAGETPGNSMQTSSTSQCQNDGSWGLVPNRCSAQTGGDWTAHFKSTSTTCMGQANYQRVCANSGAIDVSQSPPPGTAILDFMEVCNLMYA